MVEKIKQVNPPHGLARIAWRAPILLYHLGLGGLLGKRFILLNTRGRKTGLTRQAVVEVVQHNKAAGTYIAASGFGEKSDWYKNVMANPLLTIQVGRKHMSVSARRLTEPESIEVMLDYHRRHPAALRALAGMLGYRTDGSEADVRAFAVAIPFIEFRPRKTPEPVEE